VLDSWDIPANYSRAPESDQHLMELDVELIIDDPQAHNSRSQQRKTQPTSKLEQNNADIIHGLRA